MKVRINATTLRVLLAKQNLDQKELAAMSGVNENTITRLMKGGSFSSATLEKVSTALKVHPIDLIEAEGFPDPLVVASADAVV